MLLILLQGKLSQSPTHSKILGLWCSKELNR